jgi:negative regulator of replication initiation
VKIGEIEREIRDTYWWFYEQNPGVVVREMGQLARLWALADRAYVKAARSLRYDDAVYEYGQETALIAHGDTL